VEEVMEYIPSEHIKILKEDAADLSNELIAPIKDYYNQNDFEFRHSAIFYAMSLAIRTFIENTIEREHKDEALEAFVSILYFSSDFGED